MSGLFDYINGINNKSYNFTEDDKDYNTYIVNKAFSYYKDTVFYANECNKYSGMSNRMNYDFYYYALPKGKRFSKWYKKETDKNTLELIDSVSDFYEVNKEEAENILNILSAKQKEQLVDKLSKGGKQNV